VGEDKVDEQSKAGVPERASFLCGEYSSILPPTCGRRAEEAQRSGLTLCAFCRVGQKKEIPPLRIQLHCVCEAFDPPFLGLVSHNNDTHWRWFPIETSFTSSSMGSQLSCDACESKQLTPARTSCAKDEGVRIKEAHAGTVSNQKALARELFDGMANKTKRSDSRRALSYTPSSNPRSAISSQRPLLCASTPHSKLF
jgi:hypothetical protein